MAGIIIEEKINTAFRQDAMRQVYPDDAFPDIPEFY